MKKIILICVTCLMASFAMSQELSYTESPYTSASGAKPAIKQVLNYDKNLIIGYEITFNYPVEDIEAAVVKRLATEGVEGKQKKTFYIFQGIKYNYLWDKKFDMYMAFVGSKNAGTIKVILSTGYDNFIIPTQDNITTDKMFKWLTELDIDIQQYRYDVAMVAHQEEYKDIDKELSKLEKKRNNVEKKLKKNANAQSKFEASRTIVTENSVNIDTKKIEKEQKKAQQLIEERSKLEAELAAINKDITNVRSDLSKKNTAIAELKKEQPRSNNSK